MKPIKSSLLTILSFLLMFFSGYHPSLVKADEMANEEKKEVIIVYKNEDGKEDILEETEKVDYEFQTVPAISVTITEDEIQQLESNPNIDYIEENISFSITEIEPLKALQSSMATSTGGTPWNIYETNARESWNDGFTGAGVNVAVLDTGIASHKELTIAGGVSTVDYTNSWQDDNGHGTHVSGIIAAQPNIASVNGLDITGVAPGVNLFAVKVLDKAGSGNLQDILEGLDWSITNGMDIVNLSIGTSEYSKLFEQMINKAYNSGIIIVAASGNDGLQNSVNYPAKFTNTIGVSSVNQSLNISNFSSTGNEVEFSAPGENIISTYKNGDYTIESGTSQATPHVTGMLALLKEKQPNVTNSELKTLLRNHTKDLGVTGRDPYYGYGMIYYQSNLSPVTSPSVSYSTHVQTYGWLDFVSNGELSGTIGQAKRMEAIKVSLPKDNPYSGSITYSTHVQGIGWLNNVSNGTISGTLGQGKRMEAIKIQLSGEIANYYDLYYRVHAQSFGWLGWAKNGQASGTEGLSKRLEAIEIVLVKKGGQAPGSTDRAFVTKPTINYTTHVQTYGWLEYVKDGALSGTVGQSKRLEAIKIHLQNAPYSGSITYSTHVQGIGWLNNVSNGTISGTLGQGKRMEAIKIQLTGELANYYDVYYRVHAQSFGWLGWAKNGQVSGSAGLSKRLEAIEILLVSKGGQAPGSTSLPFIKR
ncbi:S8 family serine peptidase [Robertmurraya korlensis]|uniref:S8 family serine peptidase n=1 Tax=Robertmurraya korlensis TaxID=519977 RepID=UPI00203AC05A|nr:S8 family serine peptidase [Robertmurraya korlensis]MCM3602179.1 S8 family serine peptidase [Robertmurraya korlensis]